MSKLLLLSPYAMVTFNNLDIFLVERAFFSKMRIAGVSAAVLSLNMNKKEKTPEKCISGPAGGENGASPKGSLRFHPRTRRRWGVSHRFRRLIGG
jgi:hypothetical protein